MNESDVFPSDRLGAGVRQVEGTGSSDAEFERPTEYPGQGIKEKVTKNVRERKVAGDI